MEKKFKYTRELEQFLEDRDGHIGYMTKKEDLKLKGELISTHTHRYINTFFNRAFSEFQEQVFNRMWEIEAEFYQDLKAKAKREMADYLCEQ